ncbi:MAG: hypothetical protein ACN4GM_14910, partial [Gammaproteobacteria bacterium]
FNEADQLLRGRLADKLDNALHVKARLQTGYLAVNQQLELSRAKLSCLLSYWHVQIFSIVIVSNAYI